MAATELRRINVKDNSYHKPRQSEILEQLYPYAGIKLKELVKNNPNLLIYPSALGDNEDDIGSSSIFNICGGKIATGNVVGFFGIGNVRINITSRFDDERNQFFFHYMLQKIAGINMLDFKSSISEESIWDFLMYLFPEALENALLQGLFRSYVERQYNDEHLKGVIDIPRFIRTDIPFMGRIAYRTREFSVDNNVTQLIRHTIEMIRRSRIGNAVLSGETARKSVELIVQSTPSYDKNDLRKIIAANLRPLRHPYYTAYTALQKLCLMILRHEKLSYGNDSKEIYGILFDAAWLWEEYLSAILKDHGFKHPQNKKRSGGISLYFKGKKNRFPDFYNETCVLDAKYKHLDRNNISREDEYQLISYMHVLKFQKGILIYPSAETSEFSRKGELLGYGGSIGKIAFRIPVGCSDFSDFSLKMEESAAIFIRELKANVL